MTHPQNRVPARNINRIADLIRRHNVDGEELHDITSSIDLGEVECVGVSQVLWHLLFDYTTRFDVSAAFLVDEACIALYGSVTT